VLDLPHALDNPYAASIGMVQAVPHPADPHLRMLASPIKLDGVRPPARVCSPLGGDTDALLQSAGFSPAEVGALRARKVIG
jgi:crotonobetainyl-CoA:carnitine CoA-transferase CaiB-like acyl-CoA transferase